MNGSFRFGSHPFEVREARGTADVRRAVNELLAAFSLPADRGARVVIKPNLNNDLVALVGNSADLRVLCALVEALQDRGFSRITVADGSNVGIDRRGIDSLKRLRVDKLAGRYGVKVLDLNQDDGIPIPLRAGGRPLVSRTVIEAELLISVPKVKTHAEAILSCAMKNWVGICRGQAKRDMHLDLAGNILAINEAVRPHLVLVDGLVGMEGNGPGDGDPFRLDHLFACDDAFTNDLAVARLVGLSPAEVPYLRLAQGAGWFDEARVREVEAALPVLRPIQKAPARTRLAVLSEDRRLMWLKKAVRPVVDAPVVADTAYKLGIIQDRYELEDDTVRRVVRRASDCGECRRCEEVCPTGLKVDEIGVKVEMPDCINCLYCWWACPEEKIGLEGALNHLERQVGRYKKVVERL